MTDTPARKQGMIIETDEEYHGGPGVSKSGLWELWTKTPFHFRHMVHEDKPHFAIGKAAHIAILEPDTLEGRVTRGPEDRRGNKWKEAQDFAAHHQTILLTASDYDLAMLIRDVAANNRFIRQMQNSDTLVETSFYADDAETGRLIKCRPDMYSPSMKIACDLKNMADASAVEFARSVARMGYHVQDAMYSDVLTQAGHDIEAFFFVVFEKSEPPLVAVYELDAAAVAEGHAIYRAALAKYHECVKADTWPGYPEDIQTIGLRSKWDYVLTNPEEVNQP